MTRAQQINDFLTRHGFGAAALSPLAGDASFRRYTRIAQAGKTAMLMDAPPDKEDVRPYLAVARRLHRLGYSAPEILAADEASGLLLLEDLGDDSFTAVLRKNPALEPSLYEAAIDLVVEWHARKSELADRAALPLPAYDETLLLKEAGLFCEWFLPQALGREKVAALREEYLALWRGIFLAAPLSHDHWVHRDYHVDNLMWLPARAGAARIGLLDFQDAAYGDAAYDLVSLLEDARRDVPAALAEAMLARYLEKSGANRAAVMTACAVLGAQRNSKIIGIFTRLAARDGKHGYLAHLPRVWNYLEGDLAHPALSPLKAWLDRHVPAQSRGMIAIAC